MEGYSVGMHKDSSGAGRVVVNRSTRTHRYR